MKSILTRYLKDTPFPKPYRILFPDGSSFTGGEGLTSRFSIRFFTERALHDTLTRGTLGFGEAYTSGEIDVEGDLMEVTELAFALMNRKELRPGFLKRLQIAAEYLKRRNSLKGSRKNISAHYDLGNDFYSLWLDDEMQYTCAYFHSPGDTLERAQRQKMDLVCRKLRLTPGELVVEAGGGWGHLAIHAAKYYGVKVRSYNISDEQIAHARKKARAEGLDSSRIEFIHDDYRVIESEGITCDKFVSVGMLEHVGRENYKRLLRIIRNVLRREGLALIHSIGKTTPSPIDPWIEKHIFPGSYVPSLSEFVTPLESLKSDLHVADLENLRYHYALTLDHWSERFEQNLAEIIRTYDHAFARKFRLYLRSVAAGFRNGGLQLFQILLSNGYDNRAPLTRLHYYEGEESASKMDGRIIGAKENGGKAAKKRKSTRLQEEK